MKRKHSRSYYIIFGIVWLIVGIMSLLNSTIGVYADTPMKLTYTGISLIMILLSMFYMSIGMKKEQFQKEEPVQEDELEQKTESGEI